jgi:translation initiation factor IF-1
MAKSDLIEIDGVVVDVQRERFVIETKSGNVLGYLAGRQKMNNIRVVLGDRVKVEVSPYDLTKGRIIYRYATEKSHAN